MTQTFELAFSPANQFSLFEVFEGPYSFLSIHFVAPFFMCFEINDPYFILAIQHHKLLWADHLDGNLE